MNKLVPLMFFIIVTILLGEPAGMGLNPIRGHIAAGIDGFKSLAVYYGMLNESNLYWLDIDVLVFNGSRLIKQVQEGYLRYMLARGTEAYAYLHDPDTGRPLILGTVYRYVVERIWSDEQFVLYVEASIDQYNGWTTGVFLDGCSPDLFGNGSGDGGYAESFTGDLRSIVEYAHSLGLKVFINGSQVYAGPGDYYLWDRFLTAPRGESYVFDRDFFQEVNNTNPYSTVKGYAMYKYLDQHGLLEKTIALSYSDPGNPDKALTGYYLARILGLGGWGYTGNDYFKSGGRIKPLEAPLLGPAITGPFLNDTGDRASRLFLSGWVHVFISNESFSNPRLAQSPQPMVDGGLDNGYSGIPSPIICIDACLCLCNSLVKTYYMITPRFLYLYLKLSWIGWSAGAPRIYIDADNDNTTGKPVGGIGAEYYIPLGENWRVKMYRWGPGGEWRIVTGPAIIAGHLVEGSHAYMEYALGIRGNLSSRFGIRIEIPCGDVAFCHQEAVLNNTVTYRPDPTIYYEATPPSSGYALITGAEIKPYMASLTVEAPRGTLARYTVYLPYNAVSRVYKDYHVLGEKLVLGSGEGYTVSEEGGYTRLNIQVRHHSRINIVILPGGVRPLSEPRLLLLLPLLVILLILARKHVGGMRG